MILTLNWSLKNKTKALCWNICIANPQTPWYECCLSCSLNTGSSITQSSHFNIILLQYVCVLLWFKGFVWAEVVTCFSLFSLCVFSAFSFTTKDLTMNEVVWCISLNPSLLSVSSGHDSWSLSLLCDWTGLLLLSYVFPVYRHKKEGERDTSSAPVTLNH